jgi:hypothetical protein
LSSLKRKPVGVAVRNRMVGRIAKSVAAGKLSGYKGVVKMLVARYGKEKVNSMVTVILAENSRLSDNPETLFAEVSKRFKKIEDFKP